MSQSINQLGFFYNEDDIPLIKPQKFVYSEFEARTPVRFLDPSQVKMYDSEGNEIFCACGKPAETAIIGKSASKAMCSKCIQNAYRE